jgi:hypothetical protein
MAKNRILTGVGSELIEVAEELLDANFMTLKTRADCLRLLRAAIELMPAVPPNVEHGKVATRPRGVVYGE